jgi:hypothetical protein
MQITRRAALVGATALATSAQSATLASDPAFIAIEKVRAATQVFQAACERENAAEAGFVEEMGSRALVLKVDGCEIRSSDDLDTYQKECEPKWRAMIAYNAKILREKVAGINHPPGSLRLSYKLTPEETAAWEDHCVGVRQRFVSLERALPRQHTVGGSTFWPKPPRRRCTKKPTPRRRHSKRSPPAGPAPWPCWRSQRNISTRICTLTIRYRAQRRSGTASSCSDDNN